MLCFCQLSPLDDTNSAMGSVLYDSQRIYRDNFLLTFERATKEDRVVNTIIKSISDINQTCLSVDFEQWLANINFSIIFSSSSLLLREIRFREGLENGYFKYISLQTIVRPN